VQTKLTEDVTTLLIVIRDVETHKKRSFEVGISSYKVDLTKHLDAVFAVRCAHALWNNQRYQVSMSSGIVENGIRRHGEVVEVIDERTWE